LLHEVFKDNFCYVHYFPLLWDSTIEFCHKLLYCSYIWRPKWLTCCLLRKN
jgi:hypothetical protein